MEEVIEQIEWKINFLKKNIAHEREVIEEAEKRIAQFQSKIDKAERFLSKCDHAITVLRSVR